MTFSSKGTKALTRTNENARRSNVTLFKHIIPVFEKSILRNLVIGEGFSALVDTLKNKLTELCDGLWE